MVRLHDCRLRIPEGHLFETQAFKAIRLVHYHIVNMLSHKAVGLHYFGFTVLILGGIYKLALNAMFAF